jgi:hypothetical protein
MGTMNRGGKKGNRNGHFLGAEMFMSKMGREILRTIGANGEKL